MSNSITSLQFLSLTKPSEYSGLCCRRRPVYSSSKRNSVKSLLMRLDWSKEGKKYMIFLFLSGDYFFSVYFSSSSSSPPLLFVRKVVKSCGCNWLYHLFTWMFFLKHAFITLILAISYKRIYFFRDDTTSSLSYKMHNYLFLINLLSRLLNTRNSLYKY